MQKSYRQILLKDIGTCLICIAIITVLIVIAQVQSVLYQWMLVGAAIGYAMFIAAIVTRLVLFQVGKNPESYRQYFSLPITRLKEKRASMGGGRPYGSLKDGRSIYDEDVLAFLMEAQNRMDDKGYGSFAAYCKQEDESPSTVSGWLTRYKKEIAHARK